MNDKLFLLSAEEYEKYKDVIPRIKLCWWLRPDEYYSGHTFYVAHDGYVCYEGNIVRFGQNAVRPALRIENPKSLDLKVGDRVMAYQFPFIIIDEEEGLAIAEVPITLMRFDNKSNDYQNSEIHQFLAEWADKRSKEETTY